MYGSLLNVLGRGMDVDGRDLLVHWLESHLPNPGNQVRTLIAQLRSASPCQSTWQPHYTSDQPSVWDVVAMAAFDIARESPASAALRLEEVRTARPDATTAVYVLGYCYERIRQPDRAIACYQDCLKLQPDLELPLLRLAAIAMGRAQLERAIEYYQRLAASQPESLQDHLLLGQMYMAAGQYKQASATIEDAILMNPGALAWQDPDLELLIQQGQYDQALLQLDQRIAEGACSADLLAKKGQILRDMDEPQKAADAYESAAQACPTFLEALVHLAGLQAQEGRIDLAAMTYLQALEANETYIEAYTSLAKSYNLEGRTQPAIEAIQSAIELLPNSRSLLAQAARSMLIESMEREVSTKAAAQILLDLPRTKGHIDPSLTWYVSTLLCWPVRVQTSEKTRFQPANRQDLTGTYWAHESLLRFDSGDMSPLGEAVQVPPHQVLAMAYDLGLLYANRYRLAGSILNLAAKLSLWPTSLITSTLASTGLTTRAQMYYHWLEQVFRSSSMQ